MPHDVCRDDIVRALVALGIEPGDCVVVHSALSSMGWVNGGAATVIGAFLNALGPGGTLVMPSLCSRDGERRFETWDIYNSPSDVGAITEAFRLLPGTIRSDHPTHSVVAVGPMAVHITEGHESASGRPGPWGDAAFGKGSPWEKLHDIDAAIVLLGVDFKVNTMVHHIEHLVVERALQQDHAMLRGETQRRGVADRLHGWNKPGVWPGFDRMKLQRVLDARELIRRSSCGQAALMMIRAKQMVDNAVEVMEAHPREWFGPEFCAWLEDG